MLWNQDSIRGSVIRFMIPYQGKLLGLTSEHILNRAQVCLKLARGESNETRNHNKLSRVAGDFLQSRRCDSLIVTWSSHQFFWLPDQCDFSTGTVIDRKMLRVTPPRMNSRKREWP